MRTSCIRHPEKEPIIIIRKWQLDFCGKDRIAAALLSFFEYWHNVKLDQNDKSIKMNDVAESHGDGRPQYEGLWQFHTEQELEDGTLIFKRTAINTAIKKLENLGVVTVGRNPNPRYKFDRTRWFLFNPDIINDWLDHRSKSALRSIKNEGTSTKNDARRNKNDARRNKSDAAITETTTETTTEEKAGESPDPPIGNSPAQTTPQPAPALSVAPTIALAEKVAEATSYDPPAKTGAPSKAKPAKPKAEPLIYDPRKLVEGYIPAGKGATAIEVYFERYSPSTYKLTKPQQDDIKRVVTDLDVWRNAVTEWSLSGSRATDIGGMLDWYRFPERLPSNRFKPGTRPTTYANGATKPASAPATPTAARRRQFREWLLSNYHTDQPKAVPNKTTQELENEFNEWSQRQIQRE